MPEKKKAEEGFLYNANYNAAPLDERAWCKDQHHLCNQLHPSDTEKRYQIYHSLFKQMERHVSIGPPLWCGYGYYIDIENEFFMNRNGVILDEVGVTFGNYVYIIPNCGFYTAGHPLGVEQRKQRLEYASPIHVKNNIWIGTSIQVLAGVTIGEDSVVKAGSVMSKGTPDHVLTTGVPREVIRHTTKEDRRKYCIQMEGS